MNDRFARFAGWAAYVSGFASIAALVSLLLFFGLEASSGSARETHFWGPVSDIAPILQMTALSVVAIAFYRMQRAGAPRLSLISTVVGMVGMVGVVLLQILLRLNVLSFEQEVTPVLFATALAGVWLVIANRSGRRQGDLSARLAWPGIAAGAAFILEPIIFTAAGGSAAWRVFMSNYFLLGISVVVFLISYLGFPVWAFWLGRVFFSLNGEVKTRI